MKILNKKHSLAILLVVFLILSAYFSDFITIENVRSNKVWVTEFIKDNYFFSVFLFFISCIVFVNSPVPFAAVIKVLGGFFFGLHMGAIYNIISTVIACLVGFAISRYAFKEMFEKAYFERVKSIETDIETNGFYYFLSLRLVMIVPYFLINILAGISRVSFKKYLFSTLLGVMPSSLIYANGGNKLEQVDSISGLFQSEMIIAIILIALMSIFPVLMKKINMR